MHDPKIIIKNINEGIYTFENIGFSAAALYSAALARVQLEQLHALYKSLAPQESKIRENYHHRNLKMALEHDFESAVGVDELATKSYIEYRVNFGRKFLLISELSEEEIRIFKRNSVQDFDHLRISPEIFLDDASQEAKSAPLQMVYKRNIDKDLCVCLFFEGVDTFSFTQPPESFLTEEGLNDKNSLRWLRKIVTYGFHRVVIDLKNKLLITLLDVNTLDKREDPSDKFSSVINTLRNKLNIKDFLIKSNLLGFFSSIDKLFRDKNVGTVKEVYLHTSSGGRSLNTTKVVASDERDDIFLQGGIKAEDEDISITKINLNWPNIEGKPELILKGDFLMFEKPEDSLYWAEVLFSAKREGQSDFLLKPLEYAL